MLYDCYQSNNLKIFEGWMARDIGEILFNIDEQNISEAEEWINKAIESDKRNGMMWVLRYCTRGIDRYKIPVTARSPTLPH